MSRASSSRSRDLFWRPEGVGSGQSGTTPRSSFALAQDFFNVLLDALSMRGKFLPNEFPLYPQVTGQDLRVVGFSFDLPLLPFASTSDFSFYVFLVVDAQVYATDVFYILWGHLFV